jgi:hypothetical protein
MNHKVEVFNFPSFFALLHEESNMLHDIIWLSIDFFLEGLMSALHWAAVPEAPSLLLKALVLKVNIIVNSAVITEGLFR